MAANLQGGSAADSQKDGEVYYERIWKIEQFEMIQHMDEQVNNQCIQIQMEHFPNIKCSWTVSLQAKYERFRFAVVQCKLFEIKGTYSSIDATFQSELLKPNGDATNLVVTDQKFNVNTMVEQQRLGIGAFNKLNFLCPNGSFSLKLKLTLKKQTVGKANLENLASLFGVSLHENMVKLYMEQESSDLKIITSDGEELHGHKLILKMQNPVFASMFRSDLSESKTGVVNVNDICGKTMKIILRYLYTGDLLPSWNDTDIIVEFVYAAGKYQLTQVLEMLDDTLGQDMSEEYNSCIMPLLNLACKLSLKNAEAGLLKHFVQQAGKAKSGEELFDLVAYPEMDTLSASNQATPQ